LSTVIGRSISKFIITFLLPLRATSPDNSTMSSTGYSLYLTGHDEQERGTLLNALFINLTIHITFVNFKQERGTL